MKYALIFIIAAFALPVQADLYRCVEGEKTVYRDTPCTGGSRIKIILRKPVPTQPPPETRLSPNAADPTPEDRAAAYYRERADVQRAKQIQQEQDNQREHARRLAAQEEAARIDAHNAKVTRCQIAEIEVQRMEADARNKQYDPWWANRARAEREKFRTLCW